MSEPAIAVLPYGVLLGAGYLNLSCDDLEWPLGQPDRLRQKSLRDMTRDDHLIVYPRPALHYRPLFGLKARVSMMVQEPRAIHWDHRLLLRASWRKFHRVLTHDRDLISKIPNGVFVPFGTTWVPNWQELDLTKSKNCSLIASSKTSQEGHKLRHSVADYVKAQQLDVDVMGSGYRSFETKSDGLASYRYSVVIENVREPDYFTEKLLDALLCLTVPIYWGCPNIGGLFRHGSYDHLSQ
ncbi:glycosyltransferase family 10 domain-containing protein [Pseudooceanicola sp. MF1-13]|uniref:glycosyltransferase family 10 domain-containing protein n=1 Tax=Pseudooceanicola sp. MF1-13 TaxID=3379095 RepID=UPI0038925A85